MTVVCPRCKKTFANEKAARRHLQDAMRKKERLANGKTLVKKPGQARLDPVTLMPLHESNSKEKRIKQGKTRWSTWSRQ